MTTTLVTGFIDLRKYDLVERLPLKTLDFFLEKAKPLLLLPYPKVVFLEPDLIDRVCPNYENRITRFVPFTKEELFCWKYRPSILEAKLPSQRQSDKDTHDYMMVQLQKTAWLDLAIELNPFNTDQFMWLDFGVFWVVKDETLFHSAMANALGARFGKVRIPGCWSLHQQANFSMDKVMWYFCGGLLGGHKDQLRQFHQRVVQKCLSVLEKDQRWVWEVNFWYLVYLDQPDLFDWYLADHNISMIENYANK